MVLSTGDFPFFQPCYTDLRKRYNGVKAIALEAATNELNICQRNKNEAR